MTWALSITELTSMRRSVKTVCKRRWASGLSVGSNASLQQCFMAPTLVRFSMARLTASQWYALRQRSIPDSTGHCAGGVRLLKQHFVWNDGGGRSGPGSGLMAHGVFSVSHILVLAIAPHWPADFSWSRVSLTWQWLSINNLARGLQAWTGNGVVALRNTSR